MKVYLLTDFEGLMAYKRGYGVFEACGERAGAGSEFVYKVEVDVEEIQTKAKANGHVYVQRN